MAAAKKKLPEGRHLSQIKRQRQNEKIRERNSSYRSLIKNTVKKVRGAIEKKDGNLAQELLSQATKILYQVASKGVIHKKNASRRISRLAHQVGKLLKAA